MKKLITIIMLILLSAMVIAEPQQGVHEPGTGIENPELREEAQGTGQGIGGEQVVVANQGEAQQIRTETQTGNQEGEAIRARNREELKTGLENALSRVKNENAKQRLQTNMEKFEQKYEQRMQKMEGLEVEDINEETGAATIKAKEQVKWFGLFKGKATKKFEMDAQGNINEKARWYRFMYSEQTEEVAE